MYLYIHMYIHISIYTYIHVYISLSLYTYIHKYIHHITPRSSIAFAPGGMVKPPMSINPWQLPERARFWIQADPKRTAPPVNAVENG